MIATIVAVIGVSIVVFGVFSWWRFRNARPQTQRKAVKESQILIGVGLAMVIVALLIAAFQNDSPTWLKLFIVGMLLIGILVGTIRSHFRP